MTTRRQIMLGIVPVFAALALVGNVATYVLQRQATLDALRVEAGAYAVAFAAFNRPGDWRHLETGNTAATAYPAALKKLERWAMLQRLVVWRVADRRVLYNYPGGGEVAPPPPDAIAYFAAREPFVISPLIQRDHHAAMASYSPLRDTTGAIVGIVGVEVDATWVSEQMSNLRQRLLRNSLVILLVGGAVALVLSSLIERELRRLTRAAAGIEAGSYVTPPAGSVAEVTDLGHTFGVLAGVIDEVRARSHRAYAENDQFRTEDDLLALYRQAFLSPLVTTRAGVQAGLAVTTDAAGVFFDADPTGATGRICFGRVVGDATVKTATLASATGRELTDRLDRGETPAQALAETAALFALESASILTWREGEVAGQRIDFTGGQIRSAILRLPRPGETQLYHNLPPGADDPLALYLRHFPGESTPRQLEDLVPLAGANNGVLVLLSRKPDPGV